MCVGLVSLQGFCSGRQLERECAVRLCDIGARQMAAPCSQWQDAWRTDRQLSAQCVAWCRASRAAVRMVKVQLQVEHPWIAPFTGWCSARYMRLRGRAVGHSFFLLGGLVWLSFLNVHSSWWEHWMMSRPAKPSQAKFLTGGGDLCGVQIDVPPIC